MPTTVPFHGTRVFRAGEEPRPISASDWSTVRAVVVAPAADEAKFPIDTRITMFSNDTEMRAALGVGGNVAEVFDAIEDQGVVAEVELVRVAEGAGQTEAEKLEGTIANIVGSGADNSGVHAFKTSPTSGGIFICPGYDSQRLADAKNPVAAELDGIARRLRAIKVFNTPAASKEAAEEYASDFADDPRAYLFHPAVKIFTSSGTVVQPASGRVAGLFVRRDKEVGGPHESPSNQTMGGITGPSRPISYFTGEPDSEAQYLNNLHIATLRAGNILWGNETCAADPLQRFINVVRTEDYIDDAVIKAFDKWALDKNLSVPLGVAIMQSLDQFGDEAVAKGMLLGFRAWFEVDLNTDLSMASGVLRIEYDREPAAPLQDLQFGARRNVAYYAVVRDGILTALDRQYIAA
ncbi:phage tail sheath family protein [Camelimonas lactis]|uniref:Tail sheath protein subtilisin-like domain-containing protein n=1 Tax=Camelimonas lactis TaxID=659006 RepID=A0A4R2GSJ8_9HYPH|nr:phage tail protein [Camelimonas lactis]TCO12448.1 hypothetical protein EV666_10995 [Camelimonas lactis]